MILKMRNQWKLKGIEEKETNRKCKKQERLNNKNTVVKVEGKEEANQKKLNKVHNFNQKVNSQKDKDKKVATRGEDLKEAKAKILREEELLQAKPKYQEEW